MRRGILLALFAVPIAWLYHRCTLYTVYFAFDSSPPAWWWSVFKTRAADVYLWVPIVATALYLTISVPFAFLIDRLYGRFSLALAFAITTGLYVLFDLVPFVRGIAKMLPVEYWVSAFDIIRIIGILPALVWAARRLPSNNRLERSRAAASVSQGKSR
jgi:hypothetical protein